MSEKILSKIKRGVYYPGHHLGPREELDRLVESGLLDRMHPSLIYGPENEPAYCLSKKGRKRSVEGKISPKATS